MSERSNRTQEEKGANGSPDNRSGSDRRPVEEDSRFLNVTVKSVMAGVRESHIQVASTATVGTLKRLVADATEVSFEKQLLLFKDNELRDDDSPISHYGIAGDCSITLNIKMTAGVARGSSSSLANMVLMLPVQLPGGASLRPAVRGMTTVRSKPGKAGKKLSSEKPVQDEKTKMERQMENQFTRNKMRNLMKKRKKSTVFSSESTKTSTSSSVIPSVGQTPPRTPQNERDQTNVSLTNVEASDVEITEKAMKLFFEPAESMEQLVMLRKDMYTPPQNQQELEGLKKKMNELDRKRCKQCRKRLPLSDQTMRCKCEEVFCRAHRNPEEHLCPIDYKQTGRTKLQKENPKIDGGGVRKARLSK